jgi:hypothetical protein
MCTDQRRCILLLSATSCRLLRSWYDERFSCHSGSIDRFLTQKKSSFQICSLLQLQSGADVLQTNNEGSRPSIVATGSACREFLNGESQLPFRTKGKKKGLERKGLLIPVCHNSSEHEEILLRPPKPTTGRQKKGNKGAVSMDALARRRLSRGQAILSERVGKGSSAAIAGVRSGSGSTKKSVGAQPSVQQDQGTQSSTPAINVNLASRTKLAAPSALTPRQVAGDIFIPKVTAAAGKKTSGDAPEVIKTIYRQ